MSIPLSSDARPSVQQPSKSVEPSVALVINLTAAPSASLTHDISAVLNHRYRVPYALLGEIGEDLKLTLRLSDPGLIATEALVRRLLKLKGVKRVAAERVCPHRGKIYAISLRSYSA